MGEELGSIVDSMESVYILYFILFFVSHSSYKMASASIISKYIKFLLITP